MKPNSDFAFSKAIEDFIYPEMKSCHYWLLADIASDLDPEVWGDVYRDGYLWGRDWGEKFDGKKPFIKKVVETYQALTNREGLNKFINNRIDYSKEYDELEETFDIGEGCTYPDEESFYKDLDYEYIISSLKQCWETACQKDFTKKKTEEKFGDPNYPTDIKAFYQAIFMNLMSLQAALIDQGTKMTNATRETLRFICDHVTPDDFIIENESAKGNLSPKLLFDFQNQITTPKGFIRWMDSQINDNLEELRIGDSETDDYRTKQEFINDINPHEVFFVISKAWEDCTNEEKMKKIRIFEKDMKEKGICW